MSSNFFERLRDGTGKRLLEKYGDVFRIVRDQNPTFNPATGSVTVSSLTQDVRGKAFSKRSGFESDDLADTADQEIYLTANGVSFTPQAGDRIKTPTTSSTVFDIVDVRKIPESGVTVIFQIFAKR